MSVQNIREDTGLGRSTGSDPTKDGIQRTVSERSTQGQANDAYQTQHDEGRRISRSRLRVLAFTALIVAFLAGLAVMSAIKAGPNLHMFWVPLIVVLALMVASALQQRNCEKATTTKLSRMTEIAEETKIQISDILEVNLRPRVITLDNHEKVLGAASAIIGELLKEPNEEDRFLIFVGAASLSTEEESKRDSGPDDKLSPVAEFRNKLTALDVKKIPITRYISLLTASDFLQRRHPTQRNYLKWIDKQIGRLKGNPNYVIIDCLRAQPWGGSRSSLITHKAFMDIVGEGDSGLLIKDEEVARIIREKTEKFLEDVNKRGLYGGGNPETIRELEVKYVKSGRNGKNQ